MNDVFSELPVPQRKKIALIFWPKVGNQHYFVRGIRQFAVGFSHWVWKGFAPDNGSIPLLRAWKPDGIIGMIETPELARACARLAVPAIDVADRIAQLPCVSIGVDHRKIGEMAAEYFLERRFKHFAFCGVPNAYFASERQFGFERALRAAGMKCHTSWFKAAMGIPLKSAAWAEPSPKMAAWLTRLPRPLAILASDDQTGLKMLSTCFEANIRVPDEVAVLGVDDDELMCTVANPPLSSIPLPAKHIGYEAAVVLEAMMAGEQAPTERVEMPPLPIVTRGSTDHLAISDPKVKEAMALIRANIGRRFRVVDIADQLSMHRRSLERKFRRELSTGIQDEIRRARVERAMEYLRETDLSMPAIASRAGFANVTRMGVVFRRYAKVTPAAYRREFRGV